MDRPMADHREYRPPTQSQNPNIFFSSIPNSLTFWLLVDSATKWDATAESCDSKSWWNKALWYKIVVAYIFQMLKKPLLGRSSIRNCLLCRKRFRCNDEKSRFWIQLLQCFSYVSPIDVADKMNPGANMIWLQSFCDHEWSLKTFKHISV